jgi:hypothetical protein
MNYKCTLKTVPLPNASNTQPLPPTVPEALFAPQISARPVPLGALAVEKPEWVVAAKTHLT